MGISQSSMSHSNHQYPIGTNNNRSSNDTQRELSDDELRKHTIDLLHNSLFISSPSKWLALKGARVDGDDIDSIATADTTRTIDSPDMVHYHSYQRSSIPRVPRESNILLNSTTSGEIPSTNRQTYLPAKVQPLTTTTAKSSSSSSSRIPVMKNKSGGQHQQLVDVPILSKPKLLVDDSHLPVDNKNQQQCPLDNHVHDDEYDNLRRMYDHRTWNMYFRIMESREKANQRRSYAKSTSIGEGDYSSSNRGGKNHHHHPLESSSEYKQHDMNTISWSSVDNPNQRHRSNSFPEYSIHNDTTECSQDHEMIFGGIE